MKQKILLIYLVAIAVMSLVSFIAYAWDKRQAVKGNWRVSEKALLLMTALGGSVGALLGSRLFRHKTKKWYFTAVIAVSLILQAGIAIYLADFADIGKLG